MLATELRKVFLEIQKNICKLNNKVIITKVTMKEHRTKKID